MDTESTSNKDFAGNEGTPIILENGSAIGPISAGEVRHRLDKSFSGLENAPGSHEVVDTEWEYFLRQNFKGLIDVRKLLEAQYSKGGDFDILDEGCGSSLTLFQAVEDIEKHKKGDGTIKGFGLTAAPAYLSRGVPAIIKDELLATLKTSDRDQRRENLLLNGVEVSKDKGFSRESPGGNTISILKADAHYLLSVMPYQRFDLIYSSSAYPHFSAPWLAFEQACNALKVGGVVLIDSLPSRDVVSVDGKQLVPEQIQEIIQRQNPDFHVHFESSSHPFYSPMVVERRASRDFNTGLYLASVIDSRSGISRGHFANIYSEKNLKGYTPISAITRR